MNHISISTSIDGIFKKIWSDNAPYRSFFGYNDVCKISRGFYLLQIRQFCLLTKPPSSKCASSLELTKSKNLYIIMYNYIYKLIFVIQISQLLQNYTWRTWVSILLFLVILCWETFWIIIGQVTLIYNYDDKMIYS